MQFVLVIGIAERRSMTDARSLHHLDQDVHEGRTGFHDVACGASDVGDDGALAAAPGVEQTGLAYVGAPHQGYPQPLPEQLSLPCRVQGPLRPPPICLHSMSSEPHSWHACSPHAHSTHTAARLALPRGSAHEQVHDCRETVQSQLGSDSEGGHSDVAVPGTRRIMTRLLEWDSYPTGRHLDGGGQGSNACGERCAIQEGQVLVKIQPRFHLCQSLRGRKPDPKSD